MSMIWLDSPQGSDAWLEERRARFTASEWGKFVMQKDAAAKKAFLNNIENKIGEYWDGNDCDPGYQSYEMKRGTMLESTALAAYASFMASIGEEVTVKKVGLCVHEDLPLGFSADAWVTRLSDGVEWGLELKCPMAKTQRKRTRERVLPEEYACQVHGSMFLKKTPWWDFFSWHPKRAAFYQRVMPEAFTFELGQGLLDFGLALKMELAADIAEQTS